MLDGWFVRAVATLAERHVNASRANGAPVGKVIELLAAARLASAQGCAAQPPQPVEDEAGPGWASTDEIDVKEAARLMSCSATNVRKRAGRSLAAVKIGGRWVFSRETVLAAAAQRKAG